MEKNTEKKADPGGPTPLRSLGFYRQTIGEHLPAEIFEPNPWRILWFITHVAVIVACVWAVLHLPYWPLKILCGLLIGYCNGILGLISHEIAHSSVIRNRKWQDLFCFFGLMPFFISPTYWRFNH